MPLFPNRIPATKRLSAVCLLVVFDRSRQFSSTNILKDIAQNSSMLLTFKHCFHQISKHFIISSNNVILASNRKDQFFKFSSTRGLDIVSKFSHLVCITGTTHSLYSLQCENKFNLNQRKSLSELLR